MNNNLTTEALQRLKANALNASESELPTSCGQQLPPSMRCVEVVDRGSREMSVFRGRLATADEIGAAIAKLTIAFPRMRAEFFSLLAERMCEREVTASWLFYAVNRAIDSINYPEPTIADIMNIDCKVRLYTQDEYGDMIYNGQAKSEDFAGVIIGTDGTPRKILAVEKERYGIPDMIL